MVFYFLCSIGYEFPLEVEHEHQFSRLHADLEPTTVVLLSCDPSFLFCLLGFPFLLFTPHTILFLISVTSSSGFIDGV